MPCRSFAGDRACLDEEGPRNWTSMKQSILIVAHDPSLRATLARWLMAAGYAVELAEGPKRAREVVAREDVALAIVAPDRLGAAGLDLGRELGRRGGRLIMVG